MPTIKDTTLNSQKTQMYVGDKPVKNLYVKQPDGSWLPEYRYSWEAGSWGQCSASCGGGTQSRLVRCKRSDSVYRDDRFCNDITGKPSAIQSCNTYPCLPIVTMQYYCDCTLNYNTIIVSDSLSYYPTFQAYEPNWMYCVNTDMARPVSISGNYRLYFRLLFLVDEGSRDWGFLFSHVYNPFTNEIVGSYNFNIVYGRPGFPGNAYHLNWQYSNWMQWDFGVHYLNNGVSSLPWKVFLRQKYHSATAITGLHYIAVPV